MKRRRNACWLLLSVFLLVCPPPVGAQGSLKGRRTVSAVVYFTNDTPKDYVFLAELFDADKRRVAVRWTKRRGDIEFRNLRPGKYYLQVSGENICLLQYEVDARRQSETFNVFGDADCGRQKVAGLPAPRLIPRKK